MRFKNRWNIPSRGVQKEKCRERPPIKENGGETGVSALGPGVSLAMMNLREQLHQRFSLISLTIEAGREIQHTGRLSFEPREASLLAGRG